MKLLICDDEKPTLTLLENILDWKSLGISRILKAENGQKALDIINEEKPDILITDIVMPVMDGLELISRVREENFSLQIIILSAFNEFEYVRKALGYGVRGYLLKPLDESRLESLISESAAEIEASNSKTIAYRKTVDIATENLLRQLLYPRHNLEEYRKIMNMLEIRFDLDSFRLAVLSITRQNYNNYITSSESDSPDDIMIRCAGTLREKFTNMVVFFENTPDEYIILISEKKEGLTEIIIDECLKIAEESGDFSVVIAVSGTCNNCGNIHTAYEEALSFLAKRFLFENEKVLGPDLFSSGLSRKNEITGADRSRYTKKARKYITEHYNENINLDDICGFAGISKNYFCHLFKSETGLSIWDYLTEYRISKARELLTGSDMKNYEIAYSIGYENPSYFSKIFRKVTGKSPSDYRNEIRKI